MKPQTKLVLIARLEMLRKLAAEQEQQIRGYENKCVDAINQQQQQTLDTIEELEAQIEAHELVTK